MWWAEQVYEAHAFVPSIQMIYPVGGWLPSLRCAVDRIERNIHTHVSGGCSGSGSGSGEETPDICARRVYPARTQR